jgi:hypothetical protein
MINSIEKKKTGNPTSNSYQYYFSKQKDFKRKGKDETQDEKQNSPIEEESRNSYISHTVPIQFRLRYTKLRRISANQAREHSMVLRFVVWDVCVSVCV